MHAVAVMVTSRNWLAIDPLWPGAEADEAPHQVAKRRQYAEDSHDRRHVVGGVVGQMLGVEVAQDRGLKRLGDPGGPLASLLNPARVGVAQGTFGELGSVAAVDCLLSCVEVGRTG